MPFDPRSLLEKEFRTIRHTYTAKDCMLYALGVGMGMDPLDEECLPFLYEDGLKVLPSQAVMMAHPGFWAKEDATGLDWVKVLHAVPEIARNAGFREPILHGLCTLGVTTHALMKTCCDYDPGRFKRMRLRFSAPVYPGDTIRTEIWRDGDEVAFRCKSLEQDKIVINNGYLQTG